MLVVPHKTEKSYNSLRSNTYTFVLNTKMSKLEIKDFIEETYGVSVVDVKTNIRKGKAKRFNKGKHAYPGTTYRRDLQVAYVKVKDGEKIAGFDTAANTAEESETTDEKVTKVEAKDEKVTKKGLFSKKEDK